jgi:hypothetical protein
MQGEKMPARTKKSEANCHPYKIGKNYLISTVTTYELGRLVAVGEHELVIEDAAWVAYTGRFGEALKSGKIDEAEPYPSGPVIVGRGGIITAAIWDHELIRSAI